MGLVWLAQPAAVVQAVGIPYRHNMRAAHPGLRRVFVGWSFGVVELRVWDDPLPSRVNE